MEKTKAEKMIKKLETVGYKPKLISNYSGRGMFGEITFAVEVDVYFNKENAVYVWLNKLRLRVDNLGVNYVYY